MAISIRLRFEVFKRDNFTCQYCGRKTPAVVLECDHIVPVCDGGSDDLINLCTSCWECNRGKAGNPLQNIAVAEDPTDRAILLLETERQLHEYNTVLAAARERREEQAWELLRHWTNDDALDSFNRRDVSWLVAILEIVAAEEIRAYMDAAIRKGITKDLRYVKACVRNLLDGRES